MFHEMSCIINTCGHKNNLRAFFPEWASVTCQVDLYSHPAKLYRDLPCAVIISLTMALDKPGVFCTFIFVPVYRSVSNAGLTCERMVGGDSPPTWVC